MGQLWGDEQEDDRRPACRDELAHDSEIVPITAAGKSSARAAKFSVLIRGGLFGCSLAETASAGPARAESNFRFNAGEKSAEVVLAKRRVVMTRTR
jgi:hypothetical protein